MLFRSKVTGDVTDGSKIKAPVTLSDKSSIDATDTPITVEKNATATMKGNAAKPVTVEEGAKLNLSGGMTLLPEFKGATSDATVKIDANLASGEADTMSAILDKLGGDKITVGADKAATATLNSQSVKIDEDSSGKLTAFNGAQALSTEFTGSTGSTTGSFYELTLADLPDCRIKGDKFVNGSWVHMNGAFNSEGEGRETDAGNLTVTMFMGNTVTKVRYNVIPDEGDQYTIEITINH